MSKEEILDLIRRMPENVSASDVLERLYFRLQIEQGLKDAAEGRVLSEPELRERIGKWRKSAGR